MTTKLYFLLLFCLIGVNSNATQLEGDTLKSKTIEVKVNTEIKSEEEIKAQRGIDREQPVQPLNIIIGPSKLTLWGYGHAGYIFTEADGERSNEIEMTRVILMARGELTKRLSFFIMYDIVRSEMNEYYSEYAFTPSFKLRLGQLKQPFTLESTYSPTVMNNILYDNSVLYLSGMAFDPCHGSHIARDIGLMATGDFWKYKGRNLFNYSLGVFNGPGMNQRENNNQKDVIGMLNAIPAKGWLLSTSFLLGTGHAQIDSPYGAFLKGENYTRNRWACGIENKNRWVNTRAEFIIGNDGGIRSHGYYANAEYHLTKKLDLMANYDNLQRNNALDSSTTRTYMAGFQYWFFKRSRILTQYVREENIGGKTKNMLVSQVQVGF